MTFDLSIKLIIKIVVNFFYKIHYSKHRLIDLVHWNLKGNQIYTSRLSSSPRD